MEDPITLVADREAPSEVWENEAWIPTDLPVHVLRAWEAEEARRQRDNRDKEGDVTGPYTGPRGGRYWLAGKAPEALHRRRSD